MTAATDLRLVVNPGASRYEAWKGDALAAFIEYSQLANGLLFSHTEVVSALEGQGIGSAIARYALDDVRMQGQMVIPACQFIAAYIRKHSQYLDLVAESSRRAFGL